MASASVIEADSGKSKTCAAQKRYREKQKKARETVEDQVAVLTRRLSELQTANESLNARHRSLQRLSELSEAKQSESLEEHIANVPASEWDSDKGKHFARCIVDSVNMMKKPGEKLMTPDQAPDWLQDSQQFHLFRLARSKHLWELSGCTLEPSPEAKQNVVDWMEQQRDLRRRMHFVFGGQVPNFILRKRKATCHLESARLVAQATPAVAAESELTELQIQALVSASRKFVQTVGFVKEQRKQILERIKLSNAQSPGYSECAVFDSLAETAALQSELAGDLMQENETWNEFGNECLQIVSPWQEAKMNMISYINYGIIVDAWDVAFYLEMSQRREEEEADFTLLKSVEAFDELFALSTSDDALVR